MHRTAIARQLRSIAFPSISTGIYGYPIEQAARIAVSTVALALAEYRSPLEVFFCCFSERDKDARAPLESFLDLEEAVTCLPVIQEVLQGFRDQRAFRIAQEAMHALPIVESPLRSVVFDQAIDLYRQARRQGFTVRSSVDCMIAACALRHGLPVLHRDRDFSLLAKISPLEAIDLTRDFKTGKQR